jgi:tetratricopeptide (TPR) repeat protein
MHERTRRGLKYCVLAIMSLTVIAPVWAQGKKDGGGRGGRDGGGRGGRVESRRREMTVDDNWRRGGRGGDSGRRRDGDGHRRHHDHDDDDDGFAIGFNFGPVSGYYGPWYRYYGPWQGFYGPGYGYYGAWSGSYGYDWPYYYDDGYAVYGDRVIGRSYNAPDGAIVADSDTSVSSDQPPAREPAITAEGREFMRRSEEAFRRNRFDEAVRLANHAAVEMPTNGRAFLFLGQALFAVGDYGAAAGAIHQGMAMSDQNEWGAIVKNFRQYYGSGSDYTEQLRRLEKFVAEHNDAPYAHFLVGFQYGYLGHEEEARRALEKAVSLADRDEMARRLLAQFGGQAPKRERRSGDENRRAAPVPSEREPASAAPTERATDRPGEGEIRRELRPEPAAPPTVPPPQ